MATDFYTDIKRSEFCFIDEVGAKPFLLFKYYLTYSTAPNISPSLETTAKDMGLLDKSGKPSKTAVCNLNKVLIDKKWISIENGVVTILKKSFIKSERSENLNKRSEKMNESFRKSERPYKDENKQEELSEEIINTAQAHEFPLRELYEAFPDYEFQPAHLGFIVAAVKEIDRAAWTETIKIYRQNHDPTRNRYLPDKVGTLLKVFESQKRELEKQNGRVQPNKSNGNIQQQRADRAIDDYNVVEQSRANAERRRLEILQKRNAANSQ